jgi:fucose 4-O-acetylase-like acetyltransferase
MKNLHLIKLAGLLVIVSFLFLPVAGCSSLTINGIDLIKMNDLNPAYKLLIGLAMICALVLIFSQDKQLSFISSIGGVIALFLAYILAKKDIDMHKSFNILNVLELRIGSYLSFFGFIFSLVLSLLKNELFSNETPKLVYLKPIEEKDLNFCPSCGKKIENEASQFCAKCGAKL